MSIGTRARFPLLSLVVFLAACQGKPEEASREPGAENQAPPALAKLQGEPAKHPASPEVPANAEKEVPSVSDAEPAEAADDDESEAEAKDRPSKRASRGSKAAPRNRASSKDPVENTTPQATADHVELGVKRILFSRSIEGREPVDPEETFEQAETERLYAFVELSNPSKQKSKITVLFTPPSGKTSKVTLNVGEQSRWRTWALRRNAKQAGTWHVEVRDESGKKIGSRSFEVSP